MAITRASGFPAVTTSSTSSLAVTWVTVGDLAVLAAGGTNTADQLASVSSPKTTGWAQVELGIDSTDSAGNSIWIGTVTTTGADTISFTFNSVSGAPEIAADEFTAGLGASTAWTVVAHGSLRSTAGQYPSLTSGTASLQVYWSYGQTLAGGTQTGTSGFTYFTTPSYGNEITFNGALATSTAYQPVSAIDTGLIYGSGMIVSATLSFLQGADMFVGQGSTPHGMTAVSSSPTVVQAVRRGGYY